MLENIQKLWLLGKQWDAAFPDGGSLRWAITPLQNFPGILTGWKVQKHEYSISDRNWSLYIKQGEKGFKYTVGISERITYTQKTPAACSLPYPFQNRKKTSGISNTISKITKKKGGKRTAAFSGWKSPLRCVFTVTRGCNRRTKKTPSPAISN